MATNESAGTTSSTTTSVRPYRSRRNRPCDFCRKRKARCDMLEEGICALCKRVDAHCTFVAQPAKRRRADGDEVKNVNSGPTPKREGSDPPRIEAPSFGPPDELEEEEEESNEPPTVPEGFDSAVLLGLSGDQDPYLLQYYKYDDKETHTFIKHAIRRVQKGPEMPVQFLAIKDTERERKLQHEVEEQWRRVDTLASKFEERLLALYFRFAYPTYPIVDKASFYRDYYHNKRNINIGLLAGLLALSCIWWKYDPYLCVNVMPKGLNLSLYEECAIALERESKFPSLASVQCLLLLLQKRLGPSENADTYHLHCQMANLVSTSHNLGLHLDCSEWSISDSEKRLRLRLWTTVYIMEKWTCVNTGRPSLLNSNNSTVKLNYESDDPSAQLFVHMYRLTLLLDDISDDLYSLRYMKQRYHNVESTRAKVNEYFDRLREWRDALPRELKDMQSAPEGEFCKNGTINLAALTVEVLLHKVRLHPICSGLIPKPLLREYRAHAYETIQRVITFTSEITHSHLHAFWYSTTRLNFSTVAHFIYFHHITSLTPQEFKDTHETLRKWLFALRILSQGWEEGTGLAALRMDTVFWMGEDLFIEDTPGLNGEYANDEDDGESANENYGAADYYYPIGPQFNGGHDSGGVHNVHNPYDDDMILLNEDIMPQEAQSQLLETHSVPNPNAFASIYNYPDEYFPFPQTQQQQGAVFPPNFPDPFQHGASTGLTPEPAPDSVSYFESIN